MPNLKSMMKPRSHTENNIKDLESVSLNKLGRSSSINQDVAGCKDRRSRMPGDPPTMHKCETVIGSLSVMAGGSSTTQTQNSYLWPDPYEDGDMRLSQSSSRLGFLLRISPSQRNLAMSRCSIGTCCKGPASPSGTRCGLSKTHSFAAALSRLSSNRSSSALSRLPIVGQNSNRSSSVLSRSSSQGSDLGSPLTLMCKLCLADIPLSSMYELQDCHCMFCKQCVIAYVTFEIRNGSGEVTCPDACCEQKGTIQEEEMAGLVTQELIGLYRRFRLIREVAVDSSRLFCPTMGCEGVCSLPEDTVSNTQILLTCSLCGLQFCSNCRTPWHPGVKCRKEEVVSSPLEVKGVIKRCPVCGVPIERDAGCAQMMCRRCKHVFCWYCLTLLDDDFMLRHYDKGPCKNKLGHSRASVLWHRAQVVAVFFGLGILVVIASPFMLAAAPVLLCCGPCLCKDKPEIDDTDSSSREGLHRLDEVEGEDQ